MPAGIELKLSIQLLLKISCPALGKRSIKLLTHLDVFCRGTFDPKVVLLLVASISLLSYPLQFPGKLGKQAFHGLEKEDKKLKN